MGTTTGRGSLARATDDFLTSLRAERDLSPNTLAAYGYDLAQCAEWAARTNAGHLTDIARRLVRRYVASRSGNRYARRAIARKVSALRALLRWAVLPDLIS